MTGNKFITIKPIETRIPENIYNELENIIREEVKKQPDPESLMKPYEYPFENIQKIAESDNREYKESIRNMADDIWSKNDWIDAFIVYYILMHITEFIPTDFYKFGYILGKFGKYDMAEEIIQIYEKVSTNKKVTYRAIANFYYCSLDIPQKAVEYFEKYLKLDNTNALVYNSLGHLYIRTDDKNAREKQLSAFQKAYALKPDDATIVKSLLTAYEKMHNTEKIKELYPKLIELAPSPRHFLNWGLYLIGWGEFQKGYYYTAQRFDLENYPVGYPKDILPLSTRWNYKDDLSKKTILVHYEEGFGDSIMFGRFLPILKQFTSKTILVVQPPLVNLFKSSKIITDGIEVYGSISEVISKYPDKKFIHMPLMDMPYPLGVESDFIPYPDAYLTAPNPVQFNSGKFNIGIAYSGDASANYNGRDIGLKEFCDIARTDGIQLYSLQVGEAAEQLKNMPEDVSIIDLGKDFKDFIDTANAISGLDLIITSDNVILNLAGALGKKTYGVFNRYPNYRWFDLTGENVKWYNSVKPFSCDEENDWASAMKKILTGIKGVNVGGKWG
ncbi:MAG: tetratricopeptide repeat-containing glycosyltransferase family protein [Candidatus Gastranaerophilales bacterium]|nr:tetratricopeptide repeat-containing glycosyltransferase family protein [Candidatus Gastranaerophilales bacterium]